MIEKEFFWTPNSFDGTVSSFTATKFTQLHQPVYPSVLPYPTKQICCTRQDRRNKLAVMRKSFFIPYFYHFTFKSSQINLASQQTLQDIVGGTISDKTLLRCL